MEPWKILCPEPQNYSRAGLQAVSSLGVLEVRPLSRPEFEEQAPGYEVLMVRLLHRIDPPLLNTCRSLRAILSPTTGLDHIDLAGASRRGIPVFSLKDETAFLSRVPSTAEHTFALLLALVRKIPWAFQSAEAGIWEQAPFRGHELRGMTIGILGYGRIGRMVAGYAHAFGMKVVAFDPFVDEIDRCYERVVTMEELLRRSEILSIHLPLTDETVHLVGEKELSLLPRGAFLINTARGALVDEESVLAALESGRLGGAAVDVLEGEPAIGPSGRRLLDYASCHGNLVVTPHIGGATWEGIERTDLFVIEKFRQWMMATAKDGTV